MLSPHEFATLMLIRSTPEQVDATRAELVPLLDARLVSREGVWGRLTLTPAGTRLLNAVLNACRYAASAHPATA